MFEKLATELFVRFASRTTQLPPDASDKEFDQAQGWVQAAAKHAIIAASAFMLEYDGDLADAVARSDNDTPSERR